MEKYWIIDGAMMNVEDFKRIFAKEDYILIGQKSIRTAKLGMEIRDKLREAGMNVELVLGKTGHYLKKAEVDEDEEY